MGAAGDVESGRDDDDEVIRRETAEIDRGLSFFDATYGFAVTLPIANVDLRAAGQSAGGAGRPDDGG